MKKIKDDEPFYPISMASELVGVTADRLRTYEEEGLIKPFRAKTKSNKVLGHKRLYSKQDLEWIEIIRELIKAGISVPSVRMLLTLKPALAKKDVAKLPLLHNSDDKRIELVSKLYDHPLSKILVSPIEDK